MRHFIASLCAAVMASGVLASEAILFQASGDYIKRTNGKPAPLPDWLKAKDAPVMPDRFRQSTGDYYQRVTSSYRQCTPSHSITPAPNNGASC